MPPKINLNPVLNKFNQFVETNKKNEKAVGTLKINGKNGTFKVAAASESCYGKKADMKGQLANNNVRKMFFDSIVKQFGRPTLIPKNVLKALLGKEYDGGMEDESPFLSKFLTGTPLEARQIKKVIGSIEKETRGNAHWLADNLVRNAFKLLDAEAVDTKALMDSLMNLFEGALPPKWEKATHFSKDFLNEKFGTRNIGELETKVRTQVYDLLHDPDSASKNAVQPGFRGRNSYLKEQIANILENLSELFSDSRVGKKDYVDVFRNLFKDLSKGGDVRVLGDYAYDATYVTNTERIKESRYVFNPDATYDATYSTSAHAFVKDMLCAAAFAEEGTLEFGDAGDAPADKLVNWLQAKFKGTLTNLGEGQFPSFDVVKDYKGQDPVSRLKMCINLLKNDGGVKTLEGKEKTWFEAVANEVETFGQRELGDLLFRHGVTTPFESKDRETFDSIARNVFGSEAGREGGAGCIGLFGDGKAFKFLTNFSERLWFDSGVKDDEKRQVSQATAKLRETLVGFAKNISPDMENMVSKILAEKRMKGVDLLWRADVAKAIDLLAPYIWDKDGRGACWETLAEATGDSRFSSLKDVSNAITAREGQKANARANNDRVEANAGGETGAKPEENLAQPKDDGNAPGEQVGQPEGEKTEQAAEGNAPEVRGAEESVQETEQETVLKELAQYEHDELGMKMEAGDAFDPALSEDERKLVLAKDVMNACKGKHFHAAVCHVINELSQRSRAFDHGVNGSELKANMGRFKLHAYALKQFMEGFSADNSKSMKEFCGRIEKEFLYKGSGSYNGDRVVNALVGKQMDNALKLLVEMYGDQQELEEVADEGLRKQLEGNEPESNELYTKLEPNDEGESVAEEKKEEVDENAANVDQQPEGDVNVANGDQQPEGDVSVANGNQQSEGDVNDTQTRHGEEKVSDSVEATASKEETAPLKNETVPSDETVSSNETVDTAPQEMTVPKKPSIKNGGSTEEMVKFQVTSEITQAELAATGEYDRAYYTTEMSYNRRLEVAYVKMERALKGNAWFLQLSDETREMYLEEFQEAFDALKSGMINNSHVAGRSVSPMVYMSNKKGLVPDERDRKIFDIPYNLSQGVTDRTVAPETRDRLFLGMLSVQHHAQDLFFSLEESLNYEQGSDDGEGEWTGRLQKILADVTGLDCPHHIEGDGRAGRQKVAFKMSQGRKAYENRDLTFKDDRQTLIESFGQAIDVLNPKIEELTSRLKSVGNDVAGSEELRAERERVFEECMNLRNRIQQGLRAEALVFVKSYEKFYKEFETNHQVKELREHIAKYKSRYERRLKELEEADEILARLPTVEELSNRWKISSEFQLKSTRP